MEFFLPHQISLCGFQNSIFSCLWSFCICHSTSPLSCHLQDRKMKVQIYWALNDKPHIILRVVLRLLMHSVSSSVKGAPLLSWDYREGSWHTEQLSYLPEVSQVQKVRAGSPGNRLTGKILYCLWVCFFFFKKFKTHMGCPYYVHIWRRNSAPGLSAPRVSPWYNACNTVC